jgi:3-dehydroquinate dehydratase/shikimate dehydrogenase
MLCAILARQRHESLIAEMAEAAAQGAKILELRLDYLANEPRLKEILAHRPCPLIATIRRASDGGKWTASEARRIQLLKAAVVEGFDYVDLEDDVCDQVPRFGKTKRIVSHHNMTDMPRDLRGLWAALAKKDPDVVKIAGRAHKASDNFKMLRLVDRATIPTVGICMGDVGLPTRILGLKFGAPFTYAAFNPAKVVAPGLLTFHDMRNYFNIEAVRPRTRVYGVIGDPIEHSLSPLVHNWAFRELGLDCVYVPFRVSERNIERFLQRMHVAEIWGLSVTIPHKEKILEWGEPGDDLVHRARSANTIVVDESGKWRLFNTDGPAAVASLEAALPKDAPTLHNRPVLLLGAGGVARTLAFSLRDRGAVVTIASRTLARSQNLAQAVGCKFVDWAQRHTQVADVVVNGTPVGMHPNVHESPYHAGSMREGMIFFDTVYNPRMTKMLRDAEERGCRIVTGVDMFVGQAEAQFRLFTGREPPVGLMKELVLEELSPARKMLREARLARRSRS